MGRKRSRIMGETGPSYLMKTLEQLEGADWGEPEYASYVVRTVHALRKKPLDALSDEELRLALSQCFGLPWIAELALLRLEEDPFRCGDFHPGDVLASTLRLPMDFWDAQPDLHARLKALATMVDAVTRQFEHGEQDALMAMLDTSPHVERGSAD